MPIGYEPMQPMDERVYQAYGAAQARASDRDFALKAGAQAQQSAHQSSQLAQQDEHFVEQQRQQAGLAREHMNQQAAMRDQDHQAAFQLQQNRQNFEFTQADNLQLQRLNQDAAGWEQLHSSGEIDDNEFARGQQMIRNRQMPLQARRSATEQAKLQEEAKKVAEQTAAMTSINNANATFDSQHTAGDVRHFTDNATGEDLGPHQWDRHKAQWVPMRQGGSSSGSGGGTGGLGGGVNVASIYHEIAALQDTNETTGAKTPRYTGQALLDEVNSRVTGIQAAQEQLRTDNRDTRSLRPAGPMPFDPPAPRQQGDPPLTPRRVVETNFVRAIQRAESTGQVETSERLRQAAGAFRRSGGDTGIMNERDQATLGSLGYYHGEFTPDVDRQISNVARITERMASMAPFGRPAPNQQMLSAASDFRNLLMQHGGEPPESQREQRIMFNTLRGRLGFTQWPPPPSPRSDSPSILSSPPRQPITTPSPYSRVM